MDTFESITQTTTKGFAKHMFTITDSDKGELMNLLQYAFLSVIPIVALNKTIHAFIPEADPSKGSVELTVEVVTQISMLFVGMFFIHRLITFIPTYSGVAFYDLKLVNVVLSFLVIVLSLQTRLGEKVSILADRLKVAVYRALGRSTEGMEGADEEEETQMENDAAVAHAATHNAAHAVANAGVRDMMENPHMDAGMGMGGQVLPRTQMQMHEARPNFAAMHSKIGGASAPGSTFSPFRPAGLYS